MVIRVIIFLKIIETVPLILLRSWHICLFPGPRYGPECHIDKYYIIIDMNEWYYMNLHRHSYIFKLAILSSKLWNRKKNRFLNYSKAKNVKNINI